MKRLNASSTTDWKCLIIVIQILFCFSSSGTAWSPRFAVERTRLETMTPPRLPLPPKPRLHLYPPVRWPRLNLPTPTPPQFLLFTVPSVPAHQGTLHCQAVLCCIGQSSWLTSPCVFTAVAQLHLSGDWHAEEPACVFWIQSIMESVQLASQSLTLHQWGGVRQMIQLNTFQTPHCPTHKKANT